MTEINHIATKSNITVASLMDFKSICTNHGNKIIKITSEQYERFINH